MRLSKKVSQKMKSFVDSERKSFHVDKLCERNEGLEHRIGPLHERIEQCALDVDEEDN